jgi:hypothetical protein
VQAVDGLLALGDKDKDKRSLLRFAGNKSNKSTVTVSKKPRIEKIIPVSIVINIKSTSNSTIKAHH